MRRIHPVSAVLAALACLTIIVSPVSASVAVRNSAPVHLSPAVADGDAALGFIQDGKSVVDCGNGLSLDQTAAITLEAWIKTAGGVFNQGVIAKKSADEWTGNRGYSMTVYGTSHPIYSGHLMGKVGSGEAITRERVDNNTWHYIVMTWANGQTIRIYIDGKEATYESQDVVSSPVASVADLRIGQYYSDWSFNGTIDEVRVSGTQRSASEIAANWNGGQGRQLTVDTNTAGLWHMDEGSGNTAFDVTGKNNGTVLAAVWTSGFQFPGTNHPPVLNPIGNRTVKEGVLLQFPVSASDADNDTLAYSVSNLPSGAFFDNGTHVFNWTPAKGQAGIYSNVTFTISDGRASVSESITITVTSDSAVNGAALGFTEDAKSVVGCGNGLSLDQTAAITLEAWIKTAGGVLNQGVIAKKSADEWTGNRGYSMTVYGTSHPIYSGHLMGKVGSGEAITRERVDNNTWHYIVMTWANGQAIRIYIDGKEATYESQDVVSSPAASVADLRIGQYYSDWSFNGTIDEVRVSGTQRSASEIAANWNGGQGRQLTVDTNTAGLWHMDEGQSGNASLHTYTAISGYAGNPVISLGDWDEHIREISNVLYEPNDTGKEYKITYTGYSGAYAENNVYIGYAYSHDGISWTKSGRVIARSLEDPYIVKSGGLYHLFAEDKAGGGTQIRKYHSADFLSWLDDGVVLGPTGEGFEDYMVASPIIWIEGGTWYLLYEGVDGEVSMGLATSTDGKNWVRDAANPVMRARPGKWDSISVVPDDIVKIDSVYYLTYHGNSGTGFFAGKAEATDLHNWTWYDSPITQNTETLMFLFDGTYHIYGLLNAESGIGRFELASSSVLTTRDETANLNHGMLSGTTWTVGVILIP